MLVYQATAQMQADAHARGGRNHDHPDNQIWYGLELGKASKSGRLAEGKQARYVWKGRLPLGSFISTGGVRVVKDYTAAVAVFCRREERLCPQNLSRSGDLL